MIGYLLSFIILGSVVYSVFAGTPAEISNAVISSGADAVSLVLTLAGSMAVWGGIMKIAERSGITDGLTKILRPFLKLIFRGLKKDSEALATPRLLSESKLCALSNARKIPVKLLPLI